MAWFLRAIELDDSHWQCRFGREDLDVHPTLSAAVRHLTQVAADLGSVECFAHHLDGRVEVVEAADP
ncbi:hypothetical protein [Nocardioides sp. AN3]